MKVEQPALLIGDAAFARIAALAARSFDVPYVAIAVLAGSSIEVRASFGYDARIGCPVTDPVFCREIIAARDLLVIENCSYDPRFFRGHAKHGITSFAGAPIRASDGTVLGVFCLSDRNPRRFDAEESAVLRAFAALTGQRLCGETEHDGHAATRDADDRRLALLESVVLLTDVPIAITTVEPFDDPLLLYVNDSFAQAFGYQAAELIGMRAEALRDDDSPGETLELAARARSRAIALTYDFAGRCKDGDRAWFEATMSPVFDDDGVCEAYVVVLRDVTVRRSAERLQHDRGDVLELIAADAPLAHVFDAIVASAERSAAGTSASIVLRHGDALYVAACGARLRDVFGTSSLIAVGDVTQPSALAVDRCERIVADVADLPSRGYGEAARRLGIVSCVATPIRRSDGVVAGAFVQHVFADARTNADVRVGAELAHLVGIATGRRDDRERLEFLANHDPLTELPNRALFEQRLAQALARARERGRRVAVAICDLDRFKLINESLGHAAGDALLREIAGRLRHAARPDDLVARLGGDEFTVIIDDVADREEAAAAARGILLAVRPSFHCADQEVFVRACMGLCLYPDDSPDSSDLLPRCDMAVETAKARGHDIAFFEPGRGGIATSRIVLETSLNHALENDEFTVLYQPIVDLRTSTLLGAEALLRWCHPTLGNVFPDAFIPAAEETGLIVPIGAWVLEEACRFARRWQDEGLDRFVSVNVSARQFDRPDFVDTVTSALARTKLSASLLHLEVTESLVMRSPEAAEATLRALKALGVKISVDDFGTGYSSFHYLKRFSLDALKIDRVFVSDVGSGDVARNDEAIVRAIVGVAQALQLEIVAEGVETESQVTFLRDLGIRYAQGFLFARALPEADAYAWRRQTLTATFS